MNPADPTGEASRDDRAKNNMSQGQALLAAAEAAYPFRSPEGRYYVKLPTGHRRDVVPLRSRATRNSLVESYRAAHHQLPAASVVAQAVGSLEDQARTHDRVEPVFVRVGRDRNLHGGAADWDYYLDLANPSGQAVKMTPEGWSIVDRPPVHFCRPDGMLPLPTPLASGSIHLLRQTEMIEELSHAVSPKERASPRWTHSPQIFSDELKRIAPLLRTRGISVTFHRTKHARLIKINADPSFDHSVGPHFTDGIALPA